MDPQYLILIAGALACPILMGGAMWLMMRQMNSPQLPIDTNMQPPAQRIQTLQTRRETLDREIRELEKVQALETRREQLTQALAHTGEGRG